ncbi:MAG: OPT/YSL family transporter, partial [Bdellovibrionaceae bacterium]|nr:OPT/YSL family transporter [Pseudobdellovibrionaceae bacterium]
TFWWIVILSILGVLFAFPLKKRYINDEQLPFPEGRASGIVLDSLHTDSGVAGVFKAKILTFGALFSATIEVLRSETVMNLIKAPFLRIPETWDSLIYKHFTPALWGTPLKNLTIQVDSSIVMFGTGGLMNIKTGVSLLLGGFLNYFILAPYLIHQGIIPQASFKSITMWSLWGGVAMMTTSSLYSFFSKPEIIINSVKKFLNKDKIKVVDPLEKIELPLWISFIGIPIFGAIAVYLGHIWFDIHFLLGIIAIPLVFVFTLIAVNSTGQTGITPGGALGKLTQISFSILAPGNVPTNLMTAGITSEVSLNASNLLMDIKPGYMLGGKPRHQAIGHVLGIFAGALVAVPVFYQIFHGDISLFTSDKLPLPGASIWKAVAEVLTKGLSTLHPTAQTAVVVGAILGIVFEVLNKKFKGRIPFSVVGFGLAFVLRFSDSLSMALGCLFFWFASKKITDKNAFSYKAFVENQETLSAGIIAGGSIIGIVLILIESMAS